MQADFSKKLHNHLKSRGKYYWRLRQWYSLSAINLKRLFDRPKKAKKRVLFFHRYALGYDGTASLMQIFARHLDKKKYQVYIMYSDKAEPGSGVSLATDARLKYVEDGKVFPVPFEYGKVEQSQPHFISGMSPNIYRVIKTFDIDLLVAAGAGHAEFPFSAVRDIPIIFFNIFGQPNTQKNIKYHLCISKEVAGKLSPVVPKEKVKVCYVPTEGPINMAEEGKRIRQSLGIPEKDIVFGRIGRNSDAIFDPIGIEAFKRVVNEYPKIHYLIVGAPPVLTEMHKRENIPNLHFLPEMGTKEGLWAFYYAIDVLAHFRKDGESFGLNIVEAMYAERPVISHKSRIWNAHLEYLDPSFSFVAEIDNIDQYALAMEFFAADERKEKIHKMGKAAGKKAEMFHIKNFSPMFEELVESSLK